MPRWYGVLAIVVVLGILPSIALGEIGRAHDEITGDPVEVLHWTDGIWSLDGSPVPGCVTFVGGVDTGPGDTAKADSVDCDPAPNDWEWSVIVPGPFTLNYEFHGIPPGYVVCGQVFSVDGTQHVLAAVSVDTDWLVVTDLDNGIVLYEGRFSEFDPDQFGGARLSATRCGWVDILQPVPTQETQWGSIKAHYR
jgi:hypothetical protein